MRVICLIFTVYVIKSRLVTVTLLCLQLHLRTYKHNYMFRDSRPNLNRTVQSFWVFFNFIEDVLSFFYFIFQNSSLLVIGRFLWLISAEG